MISNLYDIIVIGSGISGLYSAYNIKKMFPDINLLVVEKNKRPFIGGRMGIETFYGTDIVIGAGIGRKATDYLLIELLDELHVPYKPFTVNMDYSSNHIDINKIMSELRTQFRKYKNPPSTTFKHFARSQLGDTIYKQFIVSCGFTDYENDDIYEVLYHYQMNNNSSGWIGLSIPWNKLLDKLCQKIGYNNIKTSTKITEISKIKSNPCLFKIVTDKEVELHSNKIILATTISTTQRLLHQYPIYKQIHGQPFLYVYAKFNKKSSEIMKQHVPTYTIVPGPLQKVLPMDTEKGVYMVAYSDNKNAELLKDKIENIPQNRTFFESELETIFDIPHGSLKIIALRSFYWPIGTHYYAPLNKKEFENRRAFVREAQHPEPGLLVVGEALSRNQGWTEGALESVHSVLNKKWITTVIC